MSEPSESAYWPSPWPGEDAGAARTQVSPLTPSLRVTGEATVTTKTAIASTMVVLRDEGEVYLLCHTGGDDAICWVEMIHPETLETLRRSEDLAGGPAWPGGLAAHANGSLYVVFGDHVHRLSASLDVVASRHLPRNRPYNSFVILPDGSLATKDFGGARPGDESTFRSADTELLILDPLTLEIRASHTLPEASVARLSAEGFSVYVVGVTSLWRLTWNPKDGVLEDATFRVRYLEGDEGYGWDAVIVDGSAWFLNNGAGSENYAGTLAGIGLSTRPQDVIRVDTLTGRVSRFRVNDEAGAVVANPPAVDPTRQIVVGYDSGNGVVTAWRYGVSDEESSVLWSKKWNQAQHPLVFPDSGFVLLNDFDQAASVDVVLVVNIETGDEIVRTATESPLQSVLFGAVGFSNDVYVCSFTTLTRIRFS